VRITGGERVDDDSPLVPQQLRCGVTPLGGDNRDRPPSTATTAFERAAASPSASTTARPDARNRSARCLQLLDRDIRAVRQAVTQSKHDVSAGEGRAL
jgi:hypothetical protein